MKNSDLQQGAYPGLQGMDYKMKIELKNRKFITKIEEIPEIAKEVALNKHVKAVYLFGSYSAGKVHPLSDIDLCIITDGSEDVKYPATDNLDVSFFHLLPVAVQFRVFKYGKPLIIKDKEYLFKLISKTIRAYMDFLPSLNKFTEKLLNVR